MTPSTTKQKLEILERCIDATINGVIITETKENDFRIIFANKRFVEITGYDMDEIIGKNCRFLRGSDTQQDQLDNLKSALDKEQEVEILLTNYRKNGKAFWNRLFIAPIYDSQDTLMNFIGVIHDVTEHVSMQKTLELNAHFDSLTGLANRKTLEMSIIEAEHQSQSSGESFYLIFIDLDDFKPVNDTLGHAAGDTVLLCTSKRLNDICRASDLVARIGGDEFVMLIRSIEDRSSVFKIAERINAITVKPIALEEHNCEVSISCSLGIANSQHSAGEPLQVLRNADIAMYEAKKLGRNQYYFYNELLGKQLQEHQEMRNLIDMALAGDQIFPVFLPVFNTNTDKLFGYKVLIELRKNGSHLSHQRIFNVAKNSGQLISLNTLLIQKTIKLITSSAYSTHDVQIFIPISQQFFRRPDFRRFLCELSTEFHLRTLNLCFIIPDELLLENDEDTVEKLDLINSLGIQIGLENFSASTSVLRRLRKDVLRTLFVTKSLTQNLESCVIDRAILKALVEIGRSLSIDVIFDGANTYKIKNTIKSIGGHLMTHEPGKYLINTQNGVAV